MQKISEISTIDSQDLFRALTIVKPALAKREFTKQSSCFIFWRGRVFTYNDQVLLSTPVAGMDIEGAIKGKALYQYLVCTKKNTAAIDVVEGEIIFTHGLEKAGLPIQPLQEEILSVLEKNGTPSDWASVPEGFGAALKLTLPMCSKDMSRPAFTCINIRQDGLLEATDNFRIMRCRIAPMPITTFLLPAHSAEVLIEYDVEQVSKTKDWVHFRTEADTIISCRTVENTFSNLDPILDVRGPFLDFPLAITDILDRAVVFSQQETRLENRVMITIADKQCTVRVDGDLGWFEEAADCPYQGEILNFTVNPQFLKAITNQVRSCIVGPNCLKFSGENWEHVLGVEV